MVAAGGLAASSAAAMPAIASAQPAEGRHYELATPPDKAGQFARLQGLSPDGTTIRFDNLQGNGMPGTEAQVAVANSYVARRDSRRWAYFPMNLPASLANGTFYLDAAPSLDRQIFLGFTDTLNQTMAYFVREIGHAPIQVSPDIVNRAGVQAFAVPRYNGASADLTHVVFYANRSSVGQPEISYLPTDPPPDPVVGSPQKLYEVVAGDPPILRRVDVDNDGVPIGICGGGQIGSYLRAAHAVSDDGQRIFFTAAPDCIGSAPAEQGRPRVYVRIGGEQTVEVSASECDRAADPLASPPVLACAPVASGARYESASADGDRVFFTSDDQLTDSDTDATSDLYTYDFAKPAGQRLTQISAGDATDASPGSGALVQGVVRTSDDGSRAYFVAQGVLTTNSNAEHEHAVAGQNNLYVFDTETGSIAFVAALSASGDASLYGRDSRPAQLADAAGRYLVFNSVKQLTSDDTDSAQDVYRYDATTGDLQRISIGHDGYGNNGNDDGSSVPIHPPDYTGTSGLSAKAASRQVSTDGSRIVFSTKQALQAGDVNGSWDVYEWHDGQVGMISDGHDVYGVGADGYGFLISADGSAVAFSTSQRLLPARDTDTAADIYVARLGADVDPLPAPPAPPCVGESCQAPVSGAPLVPAAATVGFVGEGNVLAEPRGTGAGVKTRIWWDRTIRGGAGQIRVRVPEPGRIHVSGAWLRGASRTAGKAGTYRMVVRLSKSGRRALRRRHAQVVRRWRALERAGHLTRRARRRLARQAVLDARVTVRFDSRSGRSSRVQVRLRFAQKAPDRRRSSSSSARAPRRAAVLSAAARKGH